MRETYHWPHIGHWEILELFFSHRLSCGKRTTEKNATKVILEALSLKLTSHFFNTLWKVIRYLTKQLKHKPSLSFMSGDGIFSANGWSVSGRIFHAIIGSTPDQWGVVTHQRQKKHQNASNK